VEAIEYKQNHKFDIAGKYLTKEEIEEQRQHLRNKLFILGYLMHRHKSESRTWGVFCADHRIGDGDECNGGSGKSVFVKFPYSLMKSKYIAGGNPKILDNQHIYQGVTEHTDQIFVDDADKYLPFRFFFDSITGPLSVNPKHGEPYTVPFENAPKFVFTSNYMPDRSDASAARRILYGVFGDYYHKKTEDNGYLETRKVYDDFGKNIFGDQYTEEEWNADLNFLMDCTQFYLSTIDVCEEIQPPMGNVRARTLRSIMTDVFFDWAQVYFSQGSENCDNCISRDKALLDFSNSTRQQKWTMNKFSKAIKAFCNLSDYVICLNPVEYQNTQGRIIRKVENKSTEMLYVQTKEDLNKLDFEKQNTPVETQTKDTIAKNDYEKLNPESNDSGKSELPF
jgi:hypothetical protein